MKKTQKQDRQVVARKRKEGQNSLDDYPTPAWATRALIESVLKPNGLFDPLMRVWEPTANRGYMVDALTEYYDYVVGTDVKQYSDRFAVLDFLSPNIDIPEHDAIITNPPFRLADEFMVRALSFRPKLLAVFGRIHLLEGKRRWSRIYSHTPPLIVATFTERVSLTRGRVDPSVSGVAHHAWFIWSQHFSEYTRLIWIPPVRSALEKEGDYLPR